MRIHLYTLIFLLISILPANSQKLYVNGYVKDMFTQLHLETPIVLTPESSFQNTNYNLIHNRINLKYNPIKNLNATIEVRNRLFSGKFVSDFPIYSSLLEFDDGLIDLSWNLAENKNNILNCAIDRINLDYSFKNFQITAGRQRVNWGINTVWNPNDIFNAFSFFDFDYEERPGSDAVRTTWFSNTTSSLELVYKAAQSIDKRALATRYRFNKYNYDFQLIGGYSGYDYVVGGGFSGDVKSISISGEATYFHPRNSEKWMSEKAFAATVAAMYSFKNSLSLNASFLYNSLGESNSSSAISYLNPNTSLSAKMLSNGKYELFAMASYPFIPIISGSFSSIMNLEDHSFYIGPSITISLLNNLELFINAQIMGGNKNSEYGSLGKFYSTFARLRWSF